MPATKWNRLEKVSRDIYRLEADEDPQISSKTFHGVNFSQFAFDDADERLVATDTRGYVYQLDLRGVEDVKYEKFEKFGLSTCLAFNPLDQSEILLASTTNDIGIHRLGTENSSHPLVRLSGHRFAVSHMSFHKGYCLSASAEEAIIWDLRTCSKSHRLSLICAGANLKKSIFSKRGQIVALYTGDNLQIWPFESFDDESRVSLRDFGLRNVKDFVFTRDSRAIVVCAARGGVVVLDTVRFELVARFDTSETPSAAKRLAIIPQTLDTGTNRILAIHSADGSLQFLDLGTGTFVEARHGDWRGIRNLAVSAQGGWLACVDVKGNLSLRRTDRIFVGKAELLARKTKEPPKSRKAHLASRHLRSVKEDVREELGLCRLLPILKEFGEYPGKHRIVIWRTIMKLPMNRDACAGLTEEVSQEASMRDMLEEYPLADKSKASLLATTVDRLVRWCPLLGQCQFLPALVFPFLVVFQKDPLLALETSITVLSNFCQKWFEYHPLPPLNVLGIVENVLLESDPTLLTCFCERGITSTDYAWPLLRTVLSEVLAANEWLILWDNLLTNQRPSLLIMCVVAYSICSREIIISLLRKPDDFRRFYATQGNVSIKELLKVARRLDSNTPERIHPNRYLRDDFVVLPNEGPYPPFLMHEYPRFLTEKQSDLVQLRALKEEEKVLREYRRQAIKIAEEKRLRTESENFVKEIQRNRMLELRRCYEEQLRITKFNVENAREEIQRCASTSGETGPRSMEHYRSMEKEVAAESSRRSRSVTTSTRSRSNNCKELRDQVQELETEVQQFLGLLRTKSSVDIG